MSNNDNVNQLGEQIRSAVQSAVNSGDFSGLTDLISGKVNLVIDEAKNQIRMEAQKHSPDYSGPKGNEAGTRQYAQDRMQMKQNWESWGQQHGINTDRSGNHYQRANRGNQPASTGRTTFNIGRAPKYKMVKIGSVSGTLLKVFGGLGIGVNSILVILSLIFKWKVGLVLCGSLWLGSFLMTQIGAFKHKRLRRAKRYADLCGDKMYANLEDIANNMQVSKFSVLKDLRKMLQMGIFPTGHLDNSGSHFILTDELYKQYQDAEKGRQIRESEQKELTDQQKAQEIAGVDEQGRDAEVEKMIADGQDCIRQLRELNDDIEGEVVSEKLFRLESLLKEIFAGVREHPEQKQQLRKFMDYYLPTTIKLVEAYREFDQVTQPGSDIISAKEEIENTLDTINIAFNELRNNLFRDRVFDVTADAQVLQTMLAQEGLTKESISQELKLQ